MINLVAKALHIIGFTCWFAGLFYVVRLFIYNVEARQKPDTERAILVAHFNIMQRRLWYGITWPAMVLTLMCGLWMLHDYPLWGSWLTLKLSLVGGLVLYHMMLGRIHRSLQDNSCRWSSRSLRVVNEVATLFLVFIVFLAVYKFSMTWLVMLKVLAGLIGLLVVGFVGYGKVRRRKDKELSHHSSE